MRYFPLTIGFQVDSANASVTAFKFAAGSLKITVEHPSPQKFNASFRAVQAYRFLDGLALNQLEDFPEAGLVRNHFGYRVEGSPFAVPFTSSNGFTGQHYRLITGRNVVDVITAEKPRFRLFQLELDGRN